MQLNYFVFILLWSSQLMANPICTPFQNLFDSIKSASVNEVIDLARGFRPVGILTALNSLGIIQYLKSKPSTSQEISQAMGLHLDSTSRLLNAALHLKILTKNSEVFTVNDSRPQFDSTASTSLLGLANKIAISGKTIFSLKEVESDANLRTALQMGQIVKVEDGYVVNPALESHLNPSNPMNLISRLQFYSNILRPLYEGEILASAVRQGQSQWSKTKHLEVTDPFNFYKDHPHLLVELMSSMHNANLESNAFAISKLVINENTRVLDVGGASGSLANTILELNPSLRKVDIYEKEGADGLLMPIFRDKVPTSNQPKINYLWGSFLEKPSDPYLHNLSREQKYDVITLGWILHDWTNTTSVSILKKAKGHLAPNGRIVLLEWILDPAKRDVSTLADIDMLLQTEGRERTISEFRDLAQQSGLTIVETHAPPTGRSVIILEASK